jgi:hypothetical protein
MLAQTRDPMLRRALLGLWVEPWRAADLKWCGTGVWPAWLDWVLQQRPELLPGLWADWCDAAGTVPGEGLEHWLELGAPLEGAWGDVARLSSLSSDGLVRVLAMCGAVSVFSRSDGGALWVESRAHLSRQQDEAWRQCLLAAWRLSRLYRLTPAEGPGCSLLSVAAYVQQGVRVLLSGARTEWREVWALVWPHWRWRLAPAWAEAVGVDVRQAWQVPVLSWDAGAFSRVWAQAIAREDGQ